MCAKYYELRSMFYIKTVLVKVGAFAIQRQNSTYFSVSGLKDKKLIKKQAYTKTETCRLYSRVF